MDLQEYYFLRMCSNDLNSSRLAFKVLKRYRRTDVRYALLRDLIVGYVRPFSGNRGFVEPRSETRDPKKTRGHKLCAEQHVPPELLPLHAQLVEARCQIFAHSDMTYTDPQIIQMKGGGHLMEFKIADYSGLLSKLTQIETLVISVERSVNDKIRECHEDPNLFGNTDSHRASGTKI